jgi:signal peptidase I
MMMLLLALALAALLVGSGVIAWARRTWLLITVDGPSMLPNLRPGDRLLIRRVPAGRVSVGDVVLAERPPGDSWLNTDAPAGRWVLKRVAALPGDPVPPGSLSVPASADGRVPPGQFILLGDNYADSVDSRLLGPCPGRRILGVTVSARARRSTAGEQA